MKNLFLSFSLLLCFGLASAQETPVKKKQSTDTIQKKNKHHTDTQKSSTRKADTINKQRTEQKKGKTSKSKNTDATSPRRDTINGTRP
ncbi:hypothetical protein [uncultured Flavobacterium sp.]|uniref:hypothetical protein n=1 Tax=uncultured Flavobacterium sp. TaxID=165435 RepID=UPI0025EAE2F9|nr:hypothetical protein [uncultured Flavobacterium sp.]